MLLINRRLRDSRSNKGMRISHTARSRTVRSRTVRANSALHLGKKELETK